MANSFGYEYVDKYIRKSYSKGCVGYLVFIHRKDLKISKRFETLEKAQLYRDVSLELCERKRIQEVKGQMNIEEYPLNLITALGLNAEAVFPNFENNLNLVLDKLTEQEKIVLKLVYKENKTYTEIGKKLDVTRSRVGQIHQKLVDKLKNYQRVLILGELATPKALMQKEFDEYMKYEREKWVYILAKRFVSEYESTHDTKDLEITCKAIESLGLANRIITHLKEQNVNVVEDIVNLKEKGLRKLENIGQKSIDTILEECEKIGVGVERSKRKKKKGENQEEVGFELNVEEDIDFNWEDEENGNKM